MFTNIVYATKISKQQKSPSQIPNNVFLKLYQLSKDEILGRKRFWYNITPNLF